MNQMDERSAASAGTADTKPIKAVPIKPRRTRSARLAMFMLRILILGLLAIPVLRWSGIVESVAFYHPQTTSPKTPAGYEDVFIKTPDGRTLHAWYMPPKGVQPGARAPAVLHCHGNMGDVSFHDGTSDYLTKAGIGVLLFDYRGFGRSTPERWLTREELMIDTEAAYEHLKNRPDVDPKRIAAFGYSLGGNFAMQIAADNPEIKGVCAVATFSSWPGIASDVIPVLGHLLIRSGLAVEDNICRLGKRPVLLVHGDRDEIVGFAHMPRIEHCGKNAGCDVRCITLTKGGHLNIFTPDIERQITEFYTSILDVR